MRYVHSLTRSAVPLLSLSNLSFHLFLGSGVVGIDGNDRVGCACSKHDAIRMEGEGRHGADALSQETIMVADQSHLLALESDNLSKKR